MMTLSLTTLASWCGATIATPSHTYHAAVTGISTDTRTLKPGNCFIALRGERHDGHDHIAAAVAAGATAVVVECDVMVPASIAVLRVSNTQQAFLHIAMAWRARQSVDGIVVTGSNGKTTVKDMLASILIAAEGEGGALATVANHNNRIGVAGMLLALKPSHRRFVLELGTNHPGEIIELAWMTQARVAIINNAQREHQEHFGTIDSVAMENGSVIAALPADGIAIFPNDSPYTVWWREMAGSRRCITVGSDTAADVQVKNIASTWDYQDIFLAGIPGLDSIRLQVMGAHNARNAATAAAAVAAVGISATAIQQGLTHYTGTPGRLQRFALAGNRTLLNDSYNANPDSVKAAIDVLATWPGRRWLVLGDMGECGDNSLVFHAELGRYARTHGITQLLTLGCDSREATQAFGKSADHFTDIESLHAQLTHLPPDVAVLVKGSRFMRMERVVNQLLSIFPVAD